MAGLCKADALPGSTIRIELILKHHRGGNESCLDLLWNAKYESWIPEQPEHALVYMDDEKRHGVGFPKRREAIIEGKRVTMDGVDVEVARALEELRRK